MEKIIPGAILFQDEVKSSSSDSIYQVTVYDNCVSCTCPAGGRKTLCKHILSVLTKNLELIKEKAPEFYNKIDVLFQLKKLNHKEDYKKLSEEILYINRKIAEQAHDNAVKVKNIKDNDFISIIDAIEQNFNDNQKEIILKILPFLKDNLGRTAMYLKRRLNKKKIQDCWNILTDEIFSIEEDYIAGGKLVNELLEKYNKKET